MAEVVMPAKLGPGESWSLRVESIPFMMDGELVDAGWQRLVFRQLPSGFVWTNSDQMGGSGVWYGPYPHLYEAVHDALRPSHWVADKPTEPPVVPDADLSAAGLI